ncbi:MAG: glycerol-3-phosphate acyltransferase [Dehalococcoidia bacterium]
MLALLLLYAYLIGSVPTAYIIGRLVKGIDIRQVGSGTVGGSNVWFHVGKLWVVPLGLFEIFVKGASPVWIGHYALGYELPSVPLVAAGLLSVVGHNWSLFLRFAGGRGIAPMVGVLFALAPWLLAAFVLVAVAGWVLTRSAALWVIISLALLPLWSLLLSLLRGQTWVILWFSLVLLGIVILKRLLANWSAPPAGLPWARVLLYRLLYDRDTRARDEWVYRQSPGMPQGG